MATRGRKPKPTAMKELEGNPGKHPLNTSEPKPNKKAHRPVQSGWSQKQRKSGADLPSRWKPSELQL